MTELMPWRIEESPDHAPLAIGKLRMLTRVPRRAARLMRGLASYRPSYAIGRSKSPPEQKMR